MGGESKCIYAQRIYIHAYKNEECIYVQAHVHVYAYMSVEASKERYTEYICISVSEIVDMHIYRYAMKVVRKKTRRERKVGVGWGVKREMREGERHITT